MDKPMDTDQGVVPEKKPPDKGKTFCLPNKPSIEDLFKKALGDSDASANKSISTGAIPKRMDKKEELHGKRQKIMENSEVKKSNNLNFTQNDSNRFAILGEIDIQKEAYFSKNGKASQTPSSQENISPNNKLNSFCPPIFLFNVNISTLISQLKEKNVLFKIINKNKNTSKLYLKDPKVHSEMMEILRTQNIQSYSYTPIEFRRKSIVLRGLYHNTVLQTLKDEINSLVPDTIESVSKFSTNFSRKNNIDTGLFLITLKEGKNTNEITSLKYLLNQKIKWEAPKANHKPIQCYRCQHWGHLSRNCNKTFVCIKCEGNHGPGECQFQSNDKTLPYCSNCKERGHPSNYRGCPAYKKYVETKKDLINKAKERRQQATQNVLEVTASKVQPNKSFASLFTSSQPTSSMVVSKPPLIEQFLKIAKYICSPETPTLEQRIEIFLKNYKNMSKNEVKEQCIALLSEVKNQYGP